jgi:RNA polymerase sigma-70 factor (ECF subfamily)
MLLVNAQEPPPTDEELTALVSDARRGDEAAFDRLARRVRETLKGWAKTMSADADEAEDLTQLSLIRMHERIAQFDGRSRFSSWLYRVVRNMAFDLRRSEARRLELERHVAILDATAADLDATADDDARFAAVVRDYRHALSAREREVFEMVDLRGLTAADTAMRLGIASATARVLLFRARRKLRARMLAGMTAGTDSSDGAT